MDEKKKSDAGDNTPVGGRPTWMQNLKTRIRDGNVLSPGGYFAWTLSAVHVVSWLAAISASAGAYAQLSSLANANEAATMAALLTMVAQLCVVLLVLVHSGGVEREDACAGLASVLLFVTVATANILSAAALSSALSLGSQSAFGATVAAAVLNALGSVMVMVFYVRWRTRANTAVAVGQAIDVQVEGPRAFV
jgi:hypothetical protein